ncbi:helix-turn-helix domain-containing protein [Stappia indica]|uniref:HTH cro/C1-type domain-containing protein n=1 Tax=Stappia indica TaxID=538381 RepID=A0A857C4X1_9HYPH|nr:hypothetical protein [Stappia indica]MCC4243402.1 hypothetical protein [Stappia indica]QGZ33941.1 hypothetical protein GH266_05095 [Stappia indica]
MTSWHDIERRRLAAGISRAELSRRAGLSESTITKGLKRKISPRNTVRTVCEQVLDEAERENAARAGAEP